MVNTVLLLNGVKSQWFACSKWFPNDSQIVHTNDFNWVSSGWSHSHRPIMAFFNFWEFLNVDYWEDYLKGALRWPPEFGQTGVCAFGGSMWTNSNGIRRIECPMSDCISFANFVCWLCILNLFTNLRMPSVCERRQPLRTHRRHTGGVGYRWVLFDVFSQCGIHTLRRTATKSARVEHFMAHHYRHFSSSLRVTRKL